MYNNYKLNCRALFKNSKYKFMLNQKMDLKNNKIVNYLKESKTELKKVTWPTKKETIKYSLLVIAISLGVAIYLGALDYVFSYLLQLIIKK